MMYQNYKCEKLNYLVCKVLVTEYLQRLLEYQPINNFMSYLSML